MAKEIKAEWCENWIKAQFTKHHAFPGPNAGIEVNHFWKKAEAAGLYERGNFDSPMSKALRKLTYCEDVRDQDGNLCYNVFKMAPKTPDMRLYKETIKRAVNWAHVTDQDYSWRVKSVTKSAAKIGWSYLDDLTKSADFSVSVKGEYNDVYIIGTAPDGHEIFASIGLTNWDDAPTIKQGIALVIKALAVYAHKVY